MNLGNPSPSQVNGAFTNMGLRKRAIADARNRVLYVHSWGLQHYRRGHPGFWDAGPVYRPPFNPNTSPFPGWPPTYTPYPGDNPIYPTPRASLAANGDDPIHLNLTGYKDICANALGQGFGGWLIDLIGPTVLSITRAVGAPNPTDNQLLDFVVTFSEPVHTVSVSDFAIDASPGITGAFVTNVAGGGSARTVTVNRGSGEGQISIDFVDHDTVYDLNWRLAGNDGVPPTPGDAGFSNGEYYIIDTGPPSVNITPDIPTPTFLTVAPFTAQFNEAVTGFTASDIQLTVTGPGTAQVVNFAGSGATYTFSVSVARSGNITVDVTIPAGAAFDVMNNPNTAGTYAGFAFNVPPGADGDPYLSDGSLGNLLMNSGDSLEIYTSVGAENPFYRINAGTPIYGELIDVGTADIVAKFNFVNVLVPAGVTVTVTGDNPLAIAATQNIEWNAALPVSGAVPGRAGGGRGGAGGAGGTGGAGGAGGGGRRRGRRCRRRGQPQPHGGFGQRLGQWRNGWSPQWGQCGRERRHWRRRQSGQPRRSRYAGFRRVGRRRHGWFRRRGRFSCLAKQ